MTNAVIAQNIKHLCKTNAISVAALLHACNISKSLIYDLEKRDKTPSADKLLSIANYFNCSVDYLLGRTDNVQSHLPSSELPPGLQLFSALDEIDRAEVRGLMRGMLKADKYKAK